MGLVWARNLTHAIFRGSGLRAEPDPRNLARVRFSLIQGDALPAGTVCARAVAAHRLAPQLMGRITADVRDSNGAAPGVERADPGGLLGGASEERAPKGPLIPRGALFSLQELPEGAPAFDWIPTPLLPSPPPPSPPLASPLPPAWRRCALKVVSYRLSTRISVPLKFSFPIRIWGHS